MSDCKHRWLLDATKAIKLDKSSLLKHPNCIGRQATCKLCGLERIQFEKIWDMSWDE